MYQANLEPMLEMYLFETNQMIEQLEEVLLKSEKASSLSSEDVNQIFRIMHTVKGSSAMMMFTNISSIAHHVEDLFYYIRENHPQGLDYSAICDLVLNALDFIRNEVFKIEGGKEATGKEGFLVEKIGHYLVQLKADSTPNAAGTSVEEKRSEKVDQKFYITHSPQRAQEFNKFIAVVLYSADCEMKYVRAFTAVHNLKDICNEIYPIPEDLFDREDGESYIAEHGLTLHFSSEHQYEEVQKHLERNLYVDSIELNEVDEFPVMNVSKGEDLARSEDNLKRLPDTSVVEISEGQDTVKNLKQNLLTVNINKLDKLMDLVGEIVITEAMVIRNPDLEGLQLDNFNKTARQLRKLTDELQDVVMSIRMIPMGPTFHKMQRIVRDMAKKIDKEVDLVISGEETEVDKNIIDHLGDPLMHLIRNAMDHGIEQLEDRRAAGKPEKGKIIIEASNTGGDVVIKISDDGKGLNKERIVEKAREKGLITKSSAEMTDREAYALILLPGFSTKEKVTEFSGRGVGLDVVKSNIEKIGGGISIESTLGKGTSISMKIPLTLAIIDGMQITTGGSLYTIPTISIRESFKANQRDLVEDTNGNEMIMIRGNCYPIIRIHKYFQIKAKTINLTEGIMVMVEGNDRAMCLFADELLGEQQVVVKPLPAYLSQYPLKNNGIGGCTILGGGSISLIIDVMAIINKTI